MRQLRLLLLMSVGLFTGCVRVEQDLVLNENGSGHLRIFYSAKEEDAERMRLVAEQMAAVDPDLSRADVDWLNSFDEEKIRAEWNKYKSPGVKLKSVKTSSAGGWRMMRAEIHFDTLQKLLDCGMLRDSHIALTRGPGGQYGYQQSINTKRLAKAIPGDVDLAHFDFLAAPLIEELRAKFQVTVPGKIIRTNADRVEGQRAVWEIKGTDPAALEKLQDIDLRLMFEGRNLRIADARMGR